MARKVINRKEMRATAEAAEKLATTKPKKAAEGEPAKKKSRAKVVKEVRLKAFWGVYNQSGKRVALFEYSQKKLADKKAAELTVSQKAPHWVKQDKEVIEG